MKIFSSFCAAILIFCCGCSHFQAPDRAVAARLQTVQNKYAPDYHLAIFNVTAVSKNGNLVVSGEVDNAEAKKEILETLSNVGRASCLPIDHLRASSSPRLRSSVAGKMPALQVVDKITVLPGRDLENRLWGITTISVANMRENPSPGAELGTQVLMGNVIRLWKKQGGWYLAQTADKYLGWIENDSFVHVTKEEAEVWIGSSDQLIVTEFLDRIWQKPEIKTFPVCDVVAGNLVKKIGAEGDWFKVELPDKRTGYLKKSSAMNFAEWKKTVVASPERVEEIARSLLGVPYLWGANSPKAVDCSGFTKTVYLLNGINLDRNASHQAKQGRDIPLTDNFSHLQKGDLLFFGRKAGTNRPEKITHVGIYLGDKIFIHSSGMVKINSLDPASSILDSRRLKSLVRARRFLPD